MRASARVYNREVPLLEPGTAFPAVTFQDENGRTTEPPRARTLFGFFKTTCPTSELAWPYLDRIWRLSRGGRLSVLAVSQDDPAETARFYGALDVAIPTLYDAEPWPVSESLGLESVPTFLLVGADGVLEEATVGFQRNKMEEFGKLAARMAGRPESPLFSPSENVPAIKPG